MPLTPAAYRDLLELQHPKLFRDSALLDQVLAGYIDLSSGTPPEALEGEPALVIVASRDERVFRKVTLPQYIPPPDTLIVNPLYEVSVEGAESTLTLSFPDT
jgi:hypothetical protein